MVKLQNTKTFAWGQSTCAPLYPLELGTLYVLDEWIIEDYSQCEGHMSENMVVEYLWLMIKSLYSLVSEME